MIQSLAWSLAVLAAAFLVAPLALYVWAYAAATGWNLARRHQAAQAIEDMKKMLESAIVAGPGPAPTTEEKRHGEEG